MCVFFNQVFLNCFFRLFIKSPSTDNINVLVLTRWHRVSYWTFHHWWSKWPHFCLDDAPPIKHTFIIPHSGRSRCLPDVQTVDQATLIQTDSGASLFKTVSLSTFLSVHPIWTLLNVMQDDAKIRLLFKEFSLSVCARSANCYYKMPVLARIILMEMPVGLRKHNYKTRSLAAIKQTTSREHNLPLTGSLRHWWGHFHIAKTNHNCRGLLWHHQYMLLGSRACKIFKLSLYTGWHKRTYRKARKQLELAVASLAEISQSNLLISALFQHLVRRDGS